MQCVGAGQGVSEIAGYAAQAGVSLLRLRCLMIAGALCDRMLASASGSAVVQNAHSADIRPMIQWVRPQPGQ